MQTIHGHGRLDRSMLKYSAIAAMVLDHTALFLLNNQTISYAACRTLGRLTAPIMCFFIAEGFTYTHSKIKYGVRLGIFALVSQIAFNFANHGLHITAEFFTQWNVMVTLLLGFVVLCCYEAIQNKALKWLAVAALCALSFLGDWGVVGPLWILFFYRYRDNDAKKSLWFAAVAMVEIGYDLYGMAAKQIPLSYGLWHFGLFLAIPLLLAYNGKKGRGGRFEKWAFYVFYPLQFVVFGVIKLLP